MVLSITKSQMSLTEFLELPETEPASEYIAGEIDRKHIPQGKHSIIQTELAPVINQIAKPQKLACAFTELRCTFAGSSIVPDIAVFEWGRIPKDQKGRIADNFHIPPDWVIEILSPRQSPNQVIKKIAFCLNHGTKLGWFLDPDDESVTIFEQNRTPVVKSGNEILTVLEVLGDWQFSVNDLFQCLYLT